MLTLPEILEARSEWTKREKFLSNCKDEDSFAKYFTIMAWYDSQIARKYREERSDGLFPPEELETRNKEAAEKERVMSLTLRNINNIKLWKNSLES